MHPVYKYINGPEWIPRLATAEMTGSSGLVRFFVRKNRRRHACTYISRKESCAIVLVERKGADDIRQKNVEKVDEIPRVQVKSVHGLNEAS